MPFIYNVATFDEMKMMSSDFVLDQHVNTLDIYSACSLKQKSARRHESHNRSTRIPILYSLIWPE